MRGGIDITGTRVEVDIAGILERVMRYTGISVNVRMSRNYNEQERLKLERAAEVCPIKHSFKSEIPIAVKYNYPELR
jgi:uncharacterized OsmC-like protein